MLAKEGEIISTKAKKAFFQILTFLAFLPYQNLNEELVPAKVELQLQEALDFCLIVKEQGHFKFLLKSLLHLMPADHGIEEYQVALLVPPKDKMLGHPP